MSNGRVDLDLEHLKSSISVMETMVDELLAVLQKPNRAQGHVYSKFNFPAKTTGEHESHLKMQLERRNKLHLDNAEFIKLTRELQVWEVVVAKLIVKLWASLAAQLEPESVLFGEAGQAKL